MPVYSFEARDPLRSSDVLSPLDLAHQWTLKSDRFLLAMVNDEPWDLSRPILADAKVAYLTHRDDEILPHWRHSCAHVLAEAVQGLFPDARVAFGPPIEHGFYYDFQCDRPLTPAGWEAIEERMRLIVACDEPFVREEWSVQDALSYFRNRGEILKAEHIQTLEQRGERVTVYRQGDWIDLCRGPHLPSTGKVGTHFKIMRVSGAYWRGDSRNPQLQRLTVTAWRTGKELATYLNYLKEVEKRDHRTLGRSMDLFHTQESAVGSVFWHPRGWIVYREVAEYIRSFQEAWGYQEVHTPQLVHRSLWEKSGHWEKFGEHMFLVSPGREGRDDSAAVAEPLGRHDSNHAIQALKPMNCPCHVEIYKRLAQSYRDLPLRLAELGSCHRNESSGSLHGIMRVRGFTQDDAHIFCREDQITDESVDFCRMLTGVYRQFGFDDFLVRYADRPDVRVGSDEAWDRAERALLEATEHAGLTTILNRGEGAFYGPKLEFVLKDAIGRQWQCGTLQVDFVLPDRLGARFVGVDGNYHTPVMLHRAILGSLERFIGILIEHYEGRLPMWLSPVQVMVATVTDAASGYAQKIVEQLRSTGVRVLLDQRNETIGYKIREHSLAKVSQIWVVGERDEKAESVVIRTLGQRNPHTMTLSDALKTIADQVQRPNVTQLSHVAVSSVIK